MTGFIERYIQKLITAALVEVFSKRSKITPPDGFHAAEQFREAAEEWVVIPFGGRPAVVKLRVLGAGEFPEASLLSFVNERAETRSFSDKIKFRNMLEHYCRHALVEPDFEFFENEVWGEQGAVKRMRARLDKLKKHAETYELDQAQKGELDELELSLGYCLPLDAMRAVAGWCECLDMTDVGRLTPEDLIVAYSLSQHYHNRASDNLRGSFLSRARKEIDLTAATLWHDRYGKRNGGKKNDGGKVERA
jgi:hypothetical protein